MEPRPGRGIYLLAAVIALFVIGWLVMKVAVTLAFYAIVGLVVFAVGAYLYRRARGALHGGRSRIDRR
jgi:hypothetical protein